MVKNLKKLRLKKGVSQQALANAVDTTQQSINKYENHNTEPDIDMLIRLADYFNTTTDFLIGRTGSSDEKGAFLDSSDFAYKYQQLSKNEKMCVDVLIDHFLSIKS